MAEVETKISFVLKLMLSMFGVPKAVACFADNHVWQQTAKGFEEADGAAWCPFTSAVMQCETDELLNVDDTQQDHRSAVAVARNSCFVLFSGKGSGEDNSRQPICNSACRCMQLESRLVIAVHA